LCSPLLRLNFYSHQRVLQDILVKEVIQQCWLESGFEISQLEFRIEKDIKYHIISQYHETNFHFFQRLLAKSGWIYVIETYDDHWRLIISDHVSRLFLGDSVSLNYHESAGLSAGQSSIFSLTENNIALPELVIVNDRYEKQAEVDLQVEEHSNSKNFGQYKTYYFGDHQMNIKETQHIAKIRQQYLEQQRQFIYAETDNMQVSLGQVVCLKDTFLQTEEFRIIGIKLKENLTIELLLIPVMIPYVLSLEEFEGSKTGLQNAKIVADSDAIAQLDEQGSYQIQYYFADDLNQASEVRQVQSLAGDQYGFHFPLQQDQEVIVLFVHTDLARPHIIGAANNPDCISTVNDENSTQHILRSFVGHELCCEDKEGDCFVHLDTAEDQQQLQLNSAKENSAVNLFNHQGEILFESGNQMNKKIDGDYKVIVQGNHTVDIHQDFIQDHQGSMTLQSHAIQINSECANQWRASVDIHCQSRVHIAQAEFHHVLEVSQGAANFSAESGYISLSAGQKITLKDKVEIQVGASRLEISSVGGILSGTAVTVISE
jgi:type VI secretion system secreted protein VgrG